MLIRVLQAGHNTVVFSSGMIRKLASANLASYGKRLSAKLSSCGPYGAATGMTYSDPQAWHLRISSLVTVAIGLSADCVSF